MCPEKDHIFKIRVAEVRSTEVRPVEVRLAKVHLAQIRLGENDSVQICASEVRTSQADLAGIYVAVAKHLGEKI